MSTLAKMYLDKNGDLALSRKGNSAGMHLTSNAEPEQGEWGFKCDCCGGKRKQSTMNITRDRRDKPIHNLTKYLVCSACYLANQVRYELVSPAEGLLFYAAGKGIKLGHLDRCAPKNWR